MWRASDARDRRAGRRGDRRSMTAPPCPSLAALIDGRRARDPDALLLRGPDDRSVTYDEAWAGGGRFANALGRLGLGPGDRVAVQVEKSASALVLYLGCLRAGLTYL